MRLLPRRDAPVTLALQPLSELRPTDTITVSVTLGEALDGVTSARVQLGYVNTYRYRWAGRRDAALGYDDTSFANMGQAGTGYGSDRETSDWVQVINEPLVVAGGRLESGTHSAALRLPSWSPGSSAMAVRWEVRAQIQKSGRDVEASEEVVVLAAAPDPVPAEMPLIQGERATANTIEFGLDTEHTCYRPGEEVRGTVRITSREPVTRTAELGMYFRFNRLSHPLERAPGDTTEGQTRPTIKVAEDLRFVQGQTTEIPFAITVPADVDPTTEAVHSSLEWFVEAQVSYAGMTGGIERARRGIVIYGA